MKQRAMILFLICAITVYALANFYLFLRGWQAISPFSISRNAYMSVCILLALSFPIGMLLAGVFPFKIGIIVQSIGNMWFIAMLYLILVVLCFDILRILHHFIPYYPVWIGSNYEKTKLICFFGALGITAFICITGYVRFSHPKIKHIVLTINKPSSIDHLKIVQVSDIHLGYQIRKARLDKYIAHINALKPDIILLCGDLVDNSIVPVLDQDLFSDLKKLQAPLGVYAVLGNHEYISRHVNAIIDSLRSAGIRVLRDEAVLIDNDFYLIGRDDKSNPKRKNTQELLSFYEVSDSLPIILMDHQPYHLEESEKNGIDLHLSGHTHNGQIWPFNYIVEQMYEVGYGYLQKGNTHVYVSSGLGIWGPLFRIGTDSEIVEITLNFQQNH